MDKVLDVTATPGRHLLVGALAITALVGASGPAEADTWIKFDGIKGEATDSKHKDEIDVLSWSWGMNAVSQDAKGKTQPACADALVISKYVDKATPQLFTATVLGSTIGTARLTVRRPNSTSEYIAIELGGVTVRSLVQGGGGDGRLPENMTLGFSSAKFSYTPQNADGSSGAAISALLPASCP
jgi:type VI secretion system secreted protein Hcp